MAKAPQNVTHAVANATGAPPVLADKAPSNERNRSELPETVHISVEAGNNNTDQQRKGSAHCEGLSRRKRCLNRRSCQGCRDAEFIKRMRTQCIVLHQLTGYRGSQCRIQTTLDVNCLQLLVLLFSESVYDFSQLTILSCSGMEPL